MKTNFGRVSPGDTLLLTKTFYSNERQLVPNAVDVTVKLLREDGVMVSLLAGSNARAVVPSNQAYMDNYASAYEVSFSVRIPDHLEGSSDGVPLNAVVELTVNDAGGNEAKLTLQEGIELFQEEDIVYGALGAVGIMPQPTALVVTDYTDIRGKSVSLSVYSGNEQVYSLHNVESTGIIRGNTLTFNLPPNPQIQVSMQPYAVIWNIEGDQHVAPFYALNPSIYLAMKELHDYVNKNCSDWAMKELTFTPEQLAAALYNGMCFFNMETPPTNFNMTNALGSIRQFWILYSAVWILRSQILNSIETDFSYTNASVTLDVDRASKYQQFADQLEGWLAEKVKPFKTNLAKRGNNGGDGSANPLTVAAGAMGTVIIAASPVMQGGGGTSNPFSWRSALLSGSSF